MAELNPEKLKVREKGFQKLKELENAGNDVTAELFLECLSHPYQFIRIESIRIVGNFRREDFISIFGTALNDECVYVAQEASEALAKINCDKALEILSDAFFEDRVERPDYLAFAISKFGQNGFDVLLEGTKNSSPNIRYFSARLLGSTGIEAAREILEQLEKEDHEKNNFGALVSTAAKKSLKTLNRIPKKLE